jgi:hypothetical protein
MPLGHKDDSLSSPHSNTMIVSIADMPHQKNRPVGMATADGCETDAA